MVDDATKFLQQLYRDNNRPRIALYNRTYYKNNKEKEMERHKVYVELNRDKINAYNRAWRKKQKTQV